MVKQFNRTSLPETINYNGSVWYYDPTDWTEYTDSNYNLKETKLVRGKHIVVNVLSRNLKGKRDAHGNLYKPSRFVFTKRKPNKITEN